MGCFTLPEYGTWEGKSYNTRHGGPYDRGSADSHYGRPMKPHYFADKTYMSDEYSEKEMTEEQIEAYIAGYKWNEVAGSKKEY